MKTAGTIIVAIASLAVAASPAIAGKKKGKGKNKAKTVQKEESRRLCDELGLGITLAPKTEGAENKAPAKTIIDDSSKQIAAADSFNLGRLDDRKSDTPTGEGAIRMEAQKLSNADAGEVIKAHEGELEYCWNRLPASKRSAASAFTLHLAIDPRGKVTALSLGGDAPAALSKCLNTAAKRWLFPIADTKSEIDYPLSFN